jgi:NAD(P)-dependent dehydrogenase (short-subunit alcohol dehydrogenase family)
MKVKDSIALVTGANRGLGKAYVEALLAAGAKKVYAGMRTVSPATDPRVVPVQLDITSAADIAAVVKQCGDITILINNAGIMLATPMVTPKSAESLRREMEVNVFGTLAMMQACAPVLARNGGGAIANMLSVVSWFTYPMNATYGASKHALLSVTDAARIELKGQGTQVVAVYAGFIDTDMASGLARPEDAKTPPRQVAERTLEGIEAGVDHVRADERAEETWKSLRSDPEGFQAFLQQVWDTRDMGAVSAKNYLG